MSELSTGHKISPIAAADTSTDAHPAPTPAELAESAAAADSDLVAEELAAAAFTETPAAMADEITMAPPPAKGNQRGLLFAGIAVLIVVVAVLLYIFKLKGGGETPPTLAAATPTPAATATPTEAELETIRAAAQVRVEQEANRIRERLEEEFPTATPRPPTATPTATELPTEVPTPTATRVPPTPTRVPPTPTPIPPTPTPSVREGDIVAEGPGVIRPVVMSQASPLYPRAAQRMGLSGEVQLQALIGINGAGEQVRILKVSHKNMGFETESEKAVRQWRYKPATKNGVKVRMWITIRIPFKQR
jgi:protein TonB